MTNHLFEGDPRGERCSPWGGGNNGGDGIWSDFDDVGGNPAMGQGQYVEGKAKELVRAASSRERWCGEGKWNKTCGWLLMAGDACLRMEERGEGGPDSERHGSSYEGGGSAPTIEQVVWWLTRGPCGTIPRFEPIQTSQTHSIQFKSFQTLIDQKSTFPCWEKIETKHRWEGFVERNNFLHKNFRFEMDFELKFWESRSIFEFWK
jgi:hypothetical protein